MKPELFKPSEDTDRVYTLTYSSGELEDRVIDLTLDGDVLRFGYPYSHGSSLQIGRIESESAEHITFTTVEPPIDLFEGVVTFRDTGEPMRWS